MLDYNAVFRRVLAQSAIRRIDIPARTTGIGQWQRQAPLHAVRPGPKSQRIDANSLLAALASSSYEGVPGRGSLTPKQPAELSAPWYGPEVI